MKPVSPIATPDASPANWVDAYAPAFAVPWLRLMRADRPIGTWLLFLPCPMGLALGMADNSARVTLLQVLWWTLLFAIGAFVMRGAGCAYNDIVDADIDAKVERTALRPIPAGQIGRSSAFAFVAVLSLIGFGVLLQFNRTAILLGFGSLALVACYPFMKRITWWPQLWLGLTFNWGVLIGFAAVTGTITTPVLVLYTGLVFWTLGYDTIYAHQDREDDALIGVRSTARRLGNHTGIALLIFYASVIILLGAALYLSGPVRVWVLLAMVPLGLHFGWQIRTLDINDGHNCLTLFKSNREAGFLLLLPLIIHAVIVGR